MKNRLLTRYFWDNIIWYTINHRLFSKWKVKCGKNPCLRGKLVISCDKLVNKEVELPRITIGSSVTINSGWKYNLIGEGDRTIFRTFDDGMIKIGDNVGMSNIALVAMDEIIIEDNVMLGGGVKIYDNDFHPLNHDERLADNFGKVKSRRIVLCEGCFIGAGSIILKGVTIGKHSIIGAGSVVRTSVPDGEIWAGNPAVYIKKI